MRNKAFELKRIDSILNDIDEIKKNPGFLKTGFYVEIASNGKLILRTGRSIEMHTHNLSMEDSENILNILRISAKDRKQKIK